MSSKTEQSFTYDLPIVLFAVIVVATLIAVFILFQKSDPLTSGVFTGTNCSLFTCPAGVNYN